MRRLYIYIKPFLPILITAILVKGSGAVTDMMIPLYMGRIIDEGIATGEISNVYRFCAVMLVLAVVTYFLNLGGNYLSGKASQKIGQNLRDKFYAHVQKLTIGAVDRFSTASLITRVTGDVENVQRTLLSMGRVMIRAPLMGLSGLALSFLIDARLASIMLFGMLLVCFTSLLLYRSTGPLFRKVQRNIDKLTTILRENLAGIRVIKSFDKTGDEIDRLDEQSAEVRRFELKAGSYNAFIGPSIALTNGITIAAILFASYYRMRGEGLAIGEVVTIVNYVNQVLSSMAKVPRIFMMFSRATTSANRIADVFETAEQSRFGKEEEPLSESVTLEFRDVSFTYPEAAARALSHVSFKIAKGETVGVIGGTGSGKTTLLSLILRLYDPDEGEILLEGRPIADYSREALSRAVTAALQQYNIFALSVGENIVLNKEKDDHRMGKAAESAQIMDMIQKVKGGFGYAITQTGTNISGGQKQRVSAARTLYREGALTVLDDVSSALDYKTDLRLRTALRTNYRGKSVLLISQRVSSVKSSDRVLVMEGGCIVGAGTHEELLAGCEAYRAICETQGVAVPEGRGGHAV